MSSQVRGLYAPVSRSWTTLNLLVENWVACTLLLLATCLIRSLYKRIMHKGIPYERKVSSKTSPCQESPRSFSFPFIFSRARYRRAPTLEVIADPPSTPLAPSPSFKPQMRYENKSRRSRTKKAVIPAAPVDTRTKQPYDAFLVLDIEGTCQLGTNFDYPNEIIEFPVCILEWKDRTEDGRGTVLEVVDEFRSFVKPTWRPILSDFCTELTGITQDQVDSAPLFSQVLVHLEAFLVKNGLIEEGTRRRLKRFCWCSDGPFDVRDFVVKQCFISQVDMPSWVQGDVLDVRSAVLQYLATTPATAPTQGIHTSGGTTRRSLNISAQLKVLALPEFEGRQHSGIDDTRNIAKIVVELARRGLCLFPNTTIHPGRRWRWMGKHGQILEEGLT